MRKSLVAGVLLFGLVVFFHGDKGGSVVLGSDLHFDFTNTLPDDVPDFTNWEKIEGEANFKEGMRLQYFFYVNAKRPNTYEIMRYRIMMKGTDGNYYPNDAREFLIWDGEKQQRCFVLVSVRNWRSLFLWKLVYWYELKQGSERYRKAMKQVLWVVAMHREMQYILKMKDVTA